MSRFRVAFDRLAEVTKNPQADPAATALLLALAAIALALLVVMAFYFLMPGPRKAARRPGAKRVRDPRRRRVIWASVTLVILATSLGTWGLTGTNRVCVDACHSDRIDLAGQEMGVHAGVSCVGCHEDAAPLGIVPALVARTERVAWEFSGSGETSGGLVPSARCLRCHEDVLAETIEDDERAIRVSHAEPVAAGMACEDCHLDIAHRPSADTVGMAPCALCHDAAVAPAACDTCHTRDPSLARTTRRTFPKVRAPLVLDCDACHD